MILNVMNKDILLVILMLFPYLMTMLGIIVTSIFKKYLLKIDEMVFTSFSSGLMLSLSIFSLLLPSFNQNQNNNVLIVIGFTFGLVLLNIINYLMMVHKRKGKGKTFFSNLLLSIIIHDAIEGLVLGFSFGNIDINLNMVLSMGISFSLAISNFLDGAFLYMTLKMNCQKEKKVIFYSFFISLIELIFLILGLLLSIKLRFLESFFLSFASSVIFFINIEDLIPLIYKEKQKIINRLFFLLGFILIMILELFLVGI